MARKKNATPSYLLHRRSGQARVVWTDLAGTRQEKTLPGKFDSVESRQAFAKLIHELASSPTKMIGQVSKTISLNEVLLAYIDHAEKHYRSAEGEPTDENRHLKTVCRYTSELYGSTLAADFGPACLKAIREKFISLGWCRKTVNARVERVRRIFKWAVAEELVPPTVYQALAAVSGLQSGRTDAKERDPVLPIDDDVVGATLLHLNRHVRGLIELQRLAGCRPGEACLIRRCDIDMSGTVWLYKPHRHKNTHRGKTRTIAVGPKAQELLKEFFTPDVSDYLFSPIRAVEEFRTERAAKRKTPVYPSQIRRNEKLRLKNPKRRPKARYNRLSYLTAVTRACDRAFPPVGDLARQPGESVAKWWVRLTTEQRAEVKAWQRKHHWHPNQLRHSFATRVRKLHGLEAAQVLLGHARADVTQVYAERNVELAVSIVAEIG